jgi:hypothetical protein
MASPHIPRALRDYPKSYALLSSSDNCDRLVVFVHGFGGKPTGTWRKFQSLVDELQDKYPWWCETDLVFYNYESRRAIQISAQDFSRFLDDIVKGEIERITITDFIPRTLFAGHTPVWNKRTYKELILVAHSEGAVVIRRSLLDGLAALERQVAAELSAEAPLEEIVESVKQRAKADLIFQSRLRLFAPACLGTNFSSMFGFAIAYSDILHAVASSIAARNDLAPKSPIIEQILKDTEAASQRYRSLNAFRAKILFGDNDHVVHVGGYNCDEVVEHEKGQTHSGICKPIAPYLRPLSLYNEF